MIKNAQTLLKEYGRLDSSTFDRSTKTEVVASAVKDATNSMDIKLVVALTESGNTARLISKYRPEADILAVTFDEITQKSLMLNWGVIPVVTEKPSSTDDMFDVAEKVALESGLVESGDNIVIVAGVPVGTGGTNTMRIRTVKILGVFFFFALSSQSTVVGDEKLTSREDRIGIPLKKSSIDVFVILYRIFK